MFIVNRSVPVKITLFLKIGSIKGIISFSVPQEAVCQLYFLFIDGFIMFSIDKSVFCFKYQYRGSDYASVFAASAALAAQTP